MNHNNFNTFRGFFVFILAFCAGITAQANEKSELVFLNWSEYVDPLLIEEFSAQYGIKVKQIFFESDQARTEMLLGTKSNGFDVVLTVGMDMESYKKSGWLAPITTNEVPNLEHAEPRWLNAFEQSAQGYGVPYLWGAMGIIYRKDKISYPIDSWKQLFKPDAALKGRVHMLRDVRDVLGLGLKSLGYSYNSRDVEELKAVERLLLAQKPSVGSYGSLVLDKSSGFVTGEYWLGMAFSGDALSLKNLDEQIEFVIPKEGTVVWCDYLTVMASSDKKQAAFKFINFLSEPKNAVRLVEYLKYPSTNRAANALLTEEYLNNPKIYPPQKILERSETGILSLPSKIKRQRISIYNRLIQ